MLGTMFYLEVQKGEEVMKTLDFQQDIGGMASCMNIIMKDTKRCGQLSSNITLFYDIWFSGFKTSKEVNVEEVDYCGPAKKSHKGFCLDTL